MTPAASSHRARRDRVRTGAFEQRCRGGKKAQFGGRAVRGHRDHVFRQQRTAAASVSRDAHIALIYESLVRPMRVASSRQTERTAQNDICCHLNDAMDCVCILTQIAGISNGKIVVGPASRFQLHCVSLFLPRRHLQRANRAGRPPRFSIADAGVLRPMRSSA